MSLIPVLIALVLFGGLLALVMILPIDATVKRIIQIIAIVTIVIWLLQRFAPALSL